MVVLIDILAILPTPGLCSAVQNKILFVGKDSKIVIFVFEFILIICIFLKFNRTPISFWFSECTIPTFIGTLYIVMERTG